MKHRFLLLLCLILFVSGITPARKIRHSLKIEKEAKKPETGKELLEGIEVTLKDSLNSTQMPIEWLGKLKKVSFAGFEKEANSNKESYILVNPTDLNICGYKVKIDYLDMQGRMLHSQMVTERCDVPPGESRKFDIKSWDSQHTYYYYLGNEPKKVATPFKVSFHPIAYWIKEK